MGNTSNDPILLRQVGDGSRKAFDTLFLCYFPKVKLFLTRLIGTPDEAEDLAQDIFFKLWINRHTLHRVESLNNYLFQMARNSAYTYFDRQQRMEEYQRRLPLPVEGGLPAPIEEELYAADLEAMIDRAIRQMPPQRQQVFILSRRHYLSNDEIAQQLSISKRTVEAHISDALSDLRRVVYLFLCMFGV